MEENKVLDTLQSTTLQKTQVEVGLVILDGYIDENKWTKKIIMWNGKQIHK